MYDLSKKTWKTIGTVPWISTASSVSLAWMGKNHLILFGSNMDQDGAIIVAYNVTLGVGSCRYPMKMYSEDAKIYCFNGRIILEASNHIGMLPYILETKRNLSSLLGSHEVMADEATEIAEWDTPTEPLINATDEIKRHLKQGITERNICLQVILPLLEKDDVGHVLRVLKEFKDIPESVVVQLLNYAIKLIKPEKVKVTNHMAFIQFCTVYNKETASYTQEDKFELLNHLFRITFSDALLIPYLRNGLTLNDTLFLLKYITYILVSSHLVIDADYESKLLDWCSLIMDAFYQQYLMTKDDKVTYMLQYTLSIVLNQIKQLGTIDSMLMTLNKFLYGKETVNEEVLSYSIELMQI